MEPGHSSAQGAAFHDKAVPPSAEMAPQHGCPKAAKEQCPDPLGHARVLEVFRAATYLDPETHRAHTVLVDRGKTGGDLVEAAAEVCLLYRRVPEPVADGLHASAITAKGPAEMEHGEGVAKCRPVLGGRTVLEHVCQGIEPAPQPGQTAEDLFHLIPFEPEQALGESLHISRRCGPLAR